jgi:FKBP-type peptidyl-prolyl cis-trans isomerase
MKRTFLSLSFCVLLLAPLSALAAGSGNAKTVADKWSDAERLSYIFGTKIGEVGKNNDISIDMKFVSRGFNDVSDGKDLALSPAQIRAAMSNFQKKVMAKRKADLSAKREANTKEGIKFLEANKKKKGVKTTPSGLQYKVIKNGKGPKPTAKDKVSVHYRGRLIDGTEFDSSYKRNKPAEFRLNKVIKGWTEGLQLMNVGSTYEFYIPANLAYGKNGPPVIGPNKTLIFEVKLLKIIK